MQFTRITYQGNKALYRDQHGNSWVKGQTQPVPDEVARALLRHPEFEPEGGRAAADKAEAKEDKKAAKDAEKQTKEQAEAEQRLKDQEDAERKQKAKDKALQDEEKAKEDMLVSVSTWDKATLREYAAKYEEELPHHSTGEAKMRLHVEGLIERYGAR